MRITVDISMYPLSEDYKPSIKAFIHKLRACDGLTLVTNQLSTQINGEFEMVTGAINRCVRESMQEQFEKGQGKVVFVTRYLNADLDITCLPDID
jgi:uncharacterized protein YqgV (UPF0045/DUF77 family)